MTVGSLPLMGGQDGKGSSDLAKPLCSLPRSTVNLVKTLVGAGMLSLPYGVAVFSDDVGVGVAYSVGLCILSGGLSAYTFWLIGRLCQATGRDTLPSAFAAVFGDSMAWVPAAAAISQTGLLTLMCSIIIADLCFSLGSVAGLDRFSWFQRDSSLCMVTLAVLFPLCMLRSLKALAPFSALGVLGLVYTALFVVYREQDGSYAEEGAFFSSAPVPSSFGEKGTHLQASFVLIAQLATSYVAHFSAPLFRRELERPTVERFGVLVASGFAGACVIMIAVMSFGFLTFGGGCQGLILDNYATRDDFAVLARGGILLGIICSYPILLGCCRDDIVEMYWKEALQTHRDRVTWALIVASTVCAMFVHNLGIVAALTGAIAGNVLCFIIPSGMFVRLHGIHSKESYVNAGLICLGFVLLFACVGVTVITALNPNFFVVQSH